MSYHRLLVRRAIGGRIREAGSLIDHAGPAVADLELLDVRDHNAWLRAMQDELSRREVLRTAAQAGSGITRCR